MPIEILKKRDYFYRSKKEILLEFKAKYPWMKLDTVIFDPEWTINDSCWILGEFGDVEIVWEGRGKDRYIKRHRAGLNADRQCYYR